MLSEASDPAAPLDGHPTVPPPTLSPVHSTAPLPQQSLYDFDDGKKLPRSASFTHLPRNGVNAPAQGIKRTFSANVLALPPENATKPNHSSVVANKELFRRASQKAKHRLSAPKYGHSSEDGSTDASVPVITRNDPDHIDRAKALSRSVTGTIKSFARRSWIGSVSRTQSPSRREACPPDHNEVRSPVGSLPLVVPDTIVVPAPVTTRSSSRSPDRSVQDDLGLARDVPQAPHLEQPVSRGLDASGATGIDWACEVSRNASATSLVSTVSSHELHLKIPSGNAPPIPQSGSSDGLSASSMDSSKKKDPLWGAFRSLEGECAHFQSKSSSQKAKVIRTSLLPFLQAHSSHSSNTSLRCEDLDRRVMVLNKWWTGLLEILNGRNNQAITGNDRPAFLEGVIGIMMRPEWRTFPSPSSSGADTPQRILIPKAQSTNSIDTNDSTFLAETIQHNVKTLFVQNLLVQLAFVVDRMSMRSAPASLVAFGGKTCAYAFFFCPGVADVLLRLWHIAPGTVRRVFAEFDIPRPFDFGATSRELALHFPPPIRHLIVTSPAALARHLQHKTQLPTGAAYIRWFGPWIGRWSGRDSDLFFVFVKYYHLLVAEHLPQAIPKQDQVCIPGLVPVHAQILAVLEATLYRQAGQTNGEKYASSITDDSENPDASLPLPMAIANAARSMAENRLIMLLRDLLGNSLSEYQLVQELYVSSFDNIVKAATRKVSLYNNDACFVLCDFMEEVLPIMSRYQQQQYQQLNDAPILDWAFWLQVCRKMMGSNNSLTEVRLLAFVYTTWNIFTSDEKRKRDFVMHWLLEPAFFDRHFNHWCPMVRHYFHRLLCWRVARYDGFASELDIEIYDALLTCLNTTWAHYQYLNADAEMRSFAAPSSAPCTPAPSRRLMIIRTDSQPASLATLTTFDKLFSATIANQSTPYKSHSSLLNSIPSADSPSPSKKRWSLFRNIIPFNSSPGNSRPGEVTPPSSADEADFPTLSTFNNHGESSTSVTTDGARSRSATPPYQHLAFKFSLEWFERSAWPARNRLLSAPELPFEAQMMLQKQSGHDVMPAIKPKKPDSDQVTTSKYGGRALAEWAQVVHECRTFFERRREEGVPRDRLIETPMLGVESFRMSG